MSGVWKRFLSVQNARSPQNTAHASQRVEAGQDKVRSAASANGDTGKPMTRRTAANSKARPKETTSTRPESAGLNRNYQKHTRIYPKAGRPRTFRSRSESFGSKSIPDLWICGFPTFHADGLGFRVSNLEWIKSRLER